MWQNDASTITNQTCCLCPRTPNYLKQWTGQQRPRLNFPTINHGAPLVEQLSFLWMIYRNQSIHQSIAFCRPMCSFIRLCVFLWTSNRVWLVRIHLSVCVCMSVCIPPSHPPDPRCKCASADKEPAGIQRSANTVCTTLNTHTGNCRFTAGKTVYMLHRTEHTHCILCSTLFESILQGKLQILHPVQSTCCTQPAMCSTLNTILHTAHY